MTTPNRVQQLRCHERLDDRRTRRTAGRYPAEFLVLGNPILRQQRPDLITRQQFHLSRPVPHGAAHAVSIRIRGQHHITTPLIRQRHRHRQGRRILRIRRFHRGESAVKNQLLWHHRDLTPRVN